MPRRTSWPRAEIRCGLTRGLIVTPTDSLETLRDPDVVLIPGSSDPLRPLQDEALIDWVKGAARSAKWLTSVCTGASIYAAAGLLAGRRATTHWAFREILQSMGVDVVAQRVVFDDPFVTGAGVSAGIDMALALTARVHGDDLAKRAQLMLEYDPHPPFDTGSPEQADARTMQAAIELLGGSRADPVVTNGPAASR
jgi:transcriptional regulator GlxA family with amidase domain